MRPEIIGDMLIITLPFVTAGVSVALTAGGIYLRYKYNNNKLVGSLVLLDQIVIEVVKELNQTIVQDLKKANADGKLTPDEAAQIKSKAINLILNRFGAGLIQVLGNSLGSVIDLVATKVEATVYDLKKGESTVRRVAKPALVNQKPKQINGG